MIRTILVFSIAQGGVVLDDEQSARSELMLAQARSNSAAPPWPPPTHMVTTP
jgi:hypothetical protein